ncbi:hypothetical protein CKY28_17425 [Sphingomonas lenta]|uniref:Uncharacterized protein n=1 Tax=Sphingomonas lenta TaxID=1141887 RepID=A0A2A2SAZ3_9SPHN|nr:hypothetical protein CKY28_17425 [Sphingomonas lenta]
MGQDDGDRVFAAELVACIGEAREPTVPELFSVAERVWVEGAAERSAFAWGRLPSAHPDRVTALRAAQAALCGDADGPV